MDEQSRPSVRTGSQCGPSLPCNRLASTRGQQSYNIELSGALRVSSVVPARAVPRGKRFLGEASHFDVAQLRVLEKGSRFPAWITVSSRQEDPHTITGPGQFAPYTLHEFANARQTMSTDARTTFPWVPFPRFFSSPLPQPEEAPGLGPEIVPDLKDEKPRLPGWGAGVAIVLGIAVGLGIFMSQRDSGSSQTTASPVVVATVEAQEADFVKSIRLGGTIGANNFAMIRAPRLRGGRDRGGGSSLTIQTLVEPGSMVSVGDVVAEFESKQMQDQLDNYASLLAQTRAMAGTRKAEILIATETLRQDYRTTRSEAEKSELDFQTAEVRSAIQAEIFDLLAQEGRASSSQLEREVELQVLANQAETRSLDLTIEQDLKRLTRTESDYEKMRIRTPVGGLVVIETMFQRGNFQQASPGDEVRAGSAFMRIVDLSKMSLFANLNQADSQTVRLGVAVDVRLDAYPDMVLPGRVTGVGAMAVTGGGGGGRRGPPGSSGTRGEWIKQVPVQIEILQQDERIQPDLSASADVILETQKDVVVVPRAAVGESGGESVVWVREEDQFAQRSVQVGSVSDTEAVIVAGLEAGEVIAAQPIPAAPELAMR